MLCADLFQHFVDYYLLCLHLVDEPLKEDVGSLAVILTEKDESIAEDLFYLDADAITKRGVGFAEDHANLFSELADEEAFLIQWLFINLEESGDSATE